MLSKKLADSKLGTKKFLARHKVAVPETLGILKNHSELDVEKIAAYEPPFVVKPNNGYGWKGILIIEEKAADGSFVTNTGEVYSPKKLVEHFTYVLDGFFSLSGGRDRVIIEKKIVLTKEIELLWKYGLPDIRIIAYNMVPVMAMIRIPTEESGWKANIHGWACAVGVDIGSGKLTYISKWGKNIKSIPGIGDVRGIVVPEWDKILSLAVQVQQVTGIHFLWCDIVLDEESGPLLLEINVRPGLEIQNVNLAPLKTRLDKVEWVDVSSVEKGVRLGRDLFSWDIEERIKNLSGKKVAWPREYLKIIHNDKAYTYIADIRISIGENMIDKTFVEDILKVEIGEKNVLRFDTEILGIVRTLRFRIWDLEGEKIRLGQNGLKWFLIDPFKYKKWETPILLNREQEKWKNSSITKTHESQLLELDKNLMKIDKKLLILKYITPRNIEEQKQIFIEKSGDYTPIFEYNEVPFDVSELKKDLARIEIPDIAGSEIFARKKWEIENKLKFFTAFADQNTSDMTLYSKKIFGDIDELYFDKAKALISEREKIVIEEDILSPEDIKDYMKKFNHIYGIKVKIQEADTTARFTMKGDTLMFRRGATVWKREMRSIIAHEVEWHYLRKLNGRKSDFSLLSRGWARYIETDEGIAIYNQNRFLTPKDKKYYSIFERYYFVQYALKHSYRRTVKHLAEFYDDDYERVFAYMLRLKRWFIDPSKEGIFMKDVVYVNGLFSVRDYLETWGTLRQLYTAKLHLDDLKVALENPAFTKHTKDLIIPFSA